MVDHVRVVLVGREALVPHRGPRSAWGRVSSSLQGMQKDLNSMLQTGLAHNLPMPATKGTLSMYDAAVNAGLGNDDAVKIVHYLLDQANSTHNRKEDLN